jgi:glycosyltransferase involved in cell wall biosynthesis
MSRIEIHIITYNEQIMLPFTIKHYRKMFGSPKFIIHDNGSTDDTLMLARLAGCEIVPFTTSGMNDTVHAQIKSKAAMNATADWVLCIDADEECFINSEDLLALESKNINAVEFEGWNIFDQVEKPEDIKIPMGIICTAYSKPVLIKTGVFQNIIFAAGAHSVTVVPKEGQQVNWSKGEYKLLHYKHWSCEWNIKRSAELGARQSKENVDRKYSYHFAFPESLHRDYFNANYSQRVPIIDHRLSEE